MAPPPPVLQRSAQTDSPPLGLLVLAPGLGQSVLGLLSALLRLFRANLGFAGNALGFLGSAAGLEHGLARLRREVPLHATRALDRPGRAVAHGLCGGLGTGCLIPGGGFTGPELVDQLAGLGAKALARCARLLDLLPDLPLYRLSRRAAAPRAHASGPYPSRYAEVRR